MSTLIYILIDPITQEIKYVGKANNLTARLYRHIYYSKKDTKSKCKSWIRSLLKKGHIPIIEMIDEVKDWNYWEKFYIAYFKFIGCDLLNMTEGGEQPPVLYGDMNPMRKKEIVQKFSNTLAHKYRPIIQYDSNNYVVKIWHGIFDVITGFPEYDKRKIQRACSNNDNQVWAYGFRWVYNDPFF